ncbi:MAG: hypothetical protein AB7O24_10865 [Kofleriaceae bacterium]
MPSRGLAVIGCAIVVACSACFEQSVPETLLCGPALDPCPQGSICNERGTCADPATLPRTCAMTGTKLLADNFQSYPIGTWNVTAPWHRVFSVRPEEIAIIDDPDQPGNQAVGLRGVESNAISSMLTFQDVDFTVRVRLLRVDTLVAIDFDHQDPPSPVTTNRVAIRTTGWNFEHKPANQTAVQLSPPAAPVFALNEWHLVRIQQVGTDLTFYRCDETSAMWQLLGTAIDSMFPGPGFVGFATVNADADFDELAAYVP